MTQIKVLVFALSFLACRFADYAAFGTEVFRNAIRRSWTNS